MAEPVLKVVVPAPLMRRFDYLPPAGGPAPLPGQRVRVPFGRGQHIGVITAVTDESELPRGRLRRALEILDVQPLLDETLRELLHWAARYYHHPPGEVYAAALPAALRRGSDPTAPPPRWFATDAGKQTDLDALGRRAPLQARLLNMILDAPDGLTRDATDLSAQSWRSGIAALTGKALIEKRSTDVQLHDSVLHEADAPPPLNAAQTDAIAAIEQQSRQYRAFLLEGVTGSGKTEIYLHCIQQQLAANRQSLVLVPEIGLTPQLVDRFRRRLGVPIAVMHSGLAGSDRLRAWTAAAQGSVNVVIGTRSAVFTPLPRAGLIIVDEEHDASFKQQDGFRYSARDVAIWRARQLDIPVVLGSATPAFESLENANSGRYQRLSLPERPGAACDPDIRLIDLRRHPPRDGLSEPLVAAIQQHLEADGQVLIYLNRRGYAPLLMCAGCGAVAECRRCDARMVYHRRQARLVCHHCGSTRPAPTICERCGDELHAIGQGTERLETALNELFPAHELVRIDRDTTRRRGELERRLDQVRSGQARLLLGTQMLTKGHDFPNVTLVGIVDADQGLFGSDFRASERLAQSVVQVAGRAGRAERAGEVLIQSFCPDHPLLQKLVTDGYAGFAADALAERRAAGWPPYGRLALLRAEAAQRDAVYAFLDAARELALQIGTDALTILGPAPAPMERRQGRYRGQLLVRATEPAPLHEFLNVWRAGLDGLRAGRSARWSLDIDPVELF